MSVSLACWRQIMFSTGARRVPASLQSCVNDPGTTTSSLSTQSGVMVLVLIAPVAGSNGTRGRRPNLPPTFVSRSRKYGSSLISQSPRLAESLNSPLQSRPLTSTNRAAAIRLAESIIAAGTRPLR